MRRAPGQHTRHSVALGDFDGRWKNPQGNTAEALYLWAQDLIKELRKGDYISNAIGTGIANSQLANMADTTIKGRAVGAGAGSPQDLTALQAAAIIGSGGQIPFQATQNASADANTLDDYEEGSWTPTLTFDTAGNLNVVYSARTGVYTKIGRMVHYTWAVATSTFTHTTAAGSLKITGLPFIGSNGLGGGRWRGITSAGFTYVTPEMDAGNSCIRLYKCGSGSIEQQITTADTPSGGTIVFVFSQHTMV